ncbi:MAG: FtsX-like permease family protein [Chlamydiota bacterium]
MSLIALMSVGVISLVVWLVLVFLSVTDGIEKNWLKKLTSLNAPITVTPTEDYYRSYYYQVDGISQESDYTYKSIGEKVASPLTDPYRPDSDQEIPKRWPEKLCNTVGSTKDLVKETFHILQGLNLTAQDYEISGAVLKLRMIRPQGIPFSKTQQKKQGYLTQVSYISTFSGKNPELPGLLEPPRVEDLNHLFFLADVSSTGVGTDTPDDPVEVSTAEFQKRLKPLLTHIDIEQMETTSHRWQAIGALLPVGVEFDAYITLKHAKVSQVVFPIGQKKCTGKIVKKQGHFHYRGDDGRSRDIDLSVPLFIEGRMSIDVESYPTKPDKIRSLHDLRFKIKTTLQGVPLEGQVPWEGLEIKKGKIKTHFETAPEVSPLWPYFIGDDAFLPSAESTAVILPKHFQNSGVQMGDIGYFSYGAATSSSVQEQRLPVTVCGFYDPGIMAIGAKVILTDPELPRLINAASQSMIDPNTVNGIQVYLQDLDTAREMKRKIEAGFERQGLSSYWTVTTFHEYDFAKDLLQQFQSDKYLFTLIGVIVLVVACSNIISLLVILVNDKRKEIAILSAMGASKKSIAMIFTLCGGIVGILSTLIGTLAAMLTLHHIDRVVGFLSLLQGHEAFNTVFYGKSLPNRLSYHGLVFISLATPIISLVAGLIPALKATRLRPSQILRSE